MHSPIAVEGRQVLALKIVVSICFRSIGILLHTVLISMARMHFLLLVSWY